MGAEQVAVERDRFGPQTWPFLDLVGGVFAEKDFAAFRIDPVAIQDLGFLEREPDLGVRLGREGAVGGVLGVVQAFVAGACKP